MSDPTALRKVRTRFPGISARAWEHPADRAALSALRAVPGLDTILQKLVGATTERSLRLITLASAVRVNDYQFHKLHQLHREACSVLDIVEPPELYVTQTPFLNARAVGVDNPFIVLNSSLVDSLNEDEMLAVIAHELGHCMSGHVLYKTLLQLLLKFSTMAFSLPMAGATLMAIIMALREWDRKSELSADRAGLLVVQNPNVCYQLEMKLAGGAHLDQMDINEFFKQASEYERGGTIVDSIFKLLNLAGQSHPFPVIRLAELKRWVDDGSYVKIMEGNYARRDDDDEDDVLKNMREAARSYKRDMNESEDPLAGVARTATRAAATAASAATGAASAAADAMRGRAKEVFDAFFNSMNSRPKGENGNGGSKKDEGGKEGRDYDTI